MGHPETLLKQRLLEFGEFGFGGEEEGDFGVGVFPKGEEIFVGGEGADASGVGIGAGGIFGLERVGASDTEVSERAGPAIPDDAGVVDDALKIGGGGGAIAGGEVRVGVGVGGVEAGDINDERNLANVEGHGSFGDFYGGGGVVFVEGELSLDGGEPEGLNLGVLGVAIA